MDTLFNESKDTMRKPIGNNYSLVFLSGYNVAVYQAGRFLKEVNIYDQFDKRLFVIDLIERYSVTKSKLADVLNISRTSVDVWLELYRSGGQKALINSTKSGVGKKKGKCQLAINLNNEKPHVNKDTEHFNDEFEEDNRFAGSFIYWGVSQATDDIMSLIYTSYGKYWHFSFLSLHFAVFAFFFIALRSLRLILFLPQSSQRFTQSSQRKVLSNFYAF